ncbi:uncharacterized protein LOC115811348, partial [Chanos chanos]|uniref:Uncharacterized protein LOC115811348 n=1 Tax=Chanos chanos TaxID=29144 RepID=A0A6J2VDS7_CHACN
MSDLLYMDYIKMYARSEQNIDSLIHTTRISSNDIVLSFRLEKSDGNNDKLEKTELLFFPSKSSPTIDAPITVEGSGMTPSGSAKNLGMTLDDQLNFSRHIAAVTQSCRFSLFNMRRICPFLMQQATLLLVQALVISCLNYCNTLLAGLQACAIRPLQLVQNAAARLLFNLPKHSHVTPLLTAIHWLLVAAHIQFKTLVLAYQATKGYTPSHLQSLITPYTPARALQSTTSDQLAVPSLWEPGSRSSQPRLFSAIVPRWWNDLPQSVRTVESLAIFRRKLKTHLFRT